MIGNYLWIKHCSVSYQFSKKVFTIDHFNLEQTFMKVYFANNVDNIVT